MRFYKQWYRPISKRSIKPPYSISKAASIDSDCCRLPTRRPAFSAIKRTDYAPTNFDQQVQVSQGHTWYKYKDRILQHAAGRVGYIPDSNIRAFGIAGDWKATALKAEVWAETVTEGGPRFMAAWRKEEVDAARHRQEKREATRLETCHRRRECRILRSHTHWPSA